MSLLLNRAKETTATLGAGTVTLGGAVVPFRTWSAAGATNGYRYSYLIEEGTAWEIGEGVYDSVGNTLTRNLVASSTGALLVLAGAATVACVAKAADDQFDVLYNAAIPNPTANIDIDVSQYDEVEVVARLVPKAVTGFGGVFLSTDNGVTFPRTTGDYVVIALAGTETATFIGGNHETSASAARTWGATIRGLRKNGVPKYMRHIVGSGGAHRLFVNSLAPVTHIRIGACAASAGAFINMTGGNLHVIGRK